MEGNKKKTKKKSSLTNDLFMSSSKVAHLSFSSKSQSCCYAKNKIAGTNILNAPV